MSQQDSPGTCEKETEVQREFWKINRRLGFLNLPKYNYRLKGRRNFFSLLVLCDPSIKIYRRSRRQPLDDRENRPVRTEGRWVMRSKLNERTGLVRKIDHYRRKTLTRKIFTVTNYVLSFDDSPIKFVDFSFIKYLSLERRGIFNMLSLLVNI